MERGAEYEGGEDRRGKAWQLSLTVIGYLAKSGRRDYGQQDDGTTRRQDRGTVGPQDYESGGRWLGLSSNQSAT